jgi:short-subunit dehydrogenase
MNQPVDFSQAVVWITGASSGIGEALALALAGRGSSLVLSARNEAALMQVRETCLERAATPEQVLVLPLDVADLDSMDDATARVLDHFGRIDLLINNAGMSQRSACIDTDMAVYEQMLRVNVLGQIALTKSVLPVMLRQGSGTLAVTASIAGKVGAPMRTGYCAAKHAVMGFFDALRTEVAASGLQVTTITPGFIRTRVAHNALDGKGRPVGQSDADIEGGMPVDASAAAIIEGFEAGTPEIAVGDGPEMALLELKRSDPIAAFRLLEEMAARNMPATDRTP